MANSTFNKELAIQFWDGATNVSQTQTGAGTLTLSADSFVLGFVHDSNVAYIAVLNPENDSTIGYMAYPSTGLPAFCACFMKAGTKIKVVGSKACVRAWPISKMF